MNRMYPIEEEKKHDCEINSNIINDNKWVCAVSNKALRTHNPIRAIVDPIVANSVKCGKERGDGKDQISLALGDPSAYSNLSPCETLLKTILATSQSRTYRGYTNACGSLEARSAISHYHSDSNHTPSIDDIIIASGCSGALELILTALLNEGDVLLVPNPGFPLYRVIVESHGGKVLCYNLNPDKHWECDLVHMEELLRNYDNIKGILVTNPSNPCGSVFSKEHLCDILGLAKRYCLPIVSDEVYGNITFKDNKFYSMGNLAVETGGDVPVIVASGLAKQFLVPGWRVGWLIFYDNKIKSLRNLKQGAINLSQIILGASHLSQSILPSILNPSAEDMHEITYFQRELNHKLENQSSFVCKRLKSVLGLNITTEPQGAMYCMVKLDIELFDNCIMNDVDFTNLLLKEENVLVLPGSVFSAINFIRIVFCAPIDVLNESCDRIEMFCGRHAAISF